MKKLWKKPEIIIMTRNHSEEQVLTVCKTSGNPGSPNDSAGGCFNFAASLCGQCSSTAGS